MRWRGLPSEPDAIEQFLKRFAKALCNNPLLLIVENAHFITNPKILQFYQSLSESPGLEIIFIYRDNVSAYIPSLLSETPGIHSTSYAPSYYSAEQELSFYEDNQIFLSKDQIRLIRNFTDGWISAVKLIVHLVQKHGTSLFDNFEQLIYTWMEQEFFLFFTQLERKRLILLTLLNDFPVELVQHLANWHGEPLSAVMRASPIIRYQLEKDTYCYARFLQTRLRDKQILLDNRDKEDFYASVGDWYHEHSRKTEAINCYLKAGAHKKLVQLLSHWEFPAPRNYAACCIDAISQLPAQLLEKNPQLRVILGQMLSASYRYEDVCVIMEKFCTTYDREEYLPQDLQTWLGEAYLIWANASDRCRIDYEKGLSLYKRAAHLLPDGSNMIRHKINYFGDHSAIQLYSPEAGAFKRSLDYIIEAEPYLIRLNSGNWQGFAALATAEYHFHIRNFKEVESYARQTIDSAVMQKQYDLICSAYFLLIRFFVAKGNYRKTMDSLQLLKAFAAEADHNQHFSIADIAESWLNLKMGQGYQTADWLQDENLYAKKVAPWNYGRDRVIRAAYLLLGQQ